jgi:hypothetical protein
VLIDGYIGIATMLEDGTITMTSRAELPSGAIGEGYFEYPPQPPELPGDPRSRPADSNPVRRWVVGPFE